MRSITIELQRFGDPSGVIRLSDRYIRSCGATEPISHVSFAVPQENLDRAMATFEYERFSHEGRDRAVAQADGIVRKLASHI